MSSPGILRRSTDDSRVSSRSVVFVGGSTDEPQKAPPQKPQEEGKQESSRTSQSRQCWICLMSDDEDSSAVWSRPCNCKGTSKWVHYSCLQRWIDEQQKSNRNKTMKCPQCKTNYLIYYPKSNALVVLLDNADALVYKVSPFITAGILIACVYWSATTYGAVATIQVAGEAEAKEIFDRMTPSVFLTALPCIPLYLIALQMVRWEDYCLVFLRKVSPRLPVLNRVLPSPVQSGYPHAEDVTDGMTCTRVFTSALLLPTVAAFFGSLFFSNVSPGVKRSIFGGLLFIGVRGIVKMYHKQELYKRRSKRQILDYTEENVRRIGDSGERMPSFFSDTEILNANSNPEDVQTVASLSQRVPKPSHSSEETLPQTSTVNKFMKDDPKTEQDPTFDPSKPSKSDAAQTSADSTFKNTRKFLHSPSNDSATLFKPPETGDPSQPRTLLDVSPEMPLKSPPLVQTSPSFHSQRTSGNPEETSLEKRNVEEEDLTENKVVRIEEMPLKSDSPGGSSKDSRTKPEAPHTLDSHALSLTPMPKSDSKDTPPSGKKGSETTKPKSKDSSFTYIN